MRLNRLLLAVMLWSGLSIPAHVAWSAAVDLSNFRTLPFPSDVMLPGPSSWNDSALLTVPFGAPSPTGTVTFTLINPINSAVFHATVPVSFGMADPNFDFAAYTQMNKLTNGPAAGFWQWTAAYSGDANYNPVPATGSPLSAFEQVQVSKAPGNFITSPSGNMVGKVLKDTADFAFGENYLPSGTITFKLFDPSNAVVDTETVTSPFDPFPISVTTPNGFLASVPGQYRWEAIYSGDANNMADTEVEPFTVSGPVPPVPEPTTLVLVGSCLAGLGAVAWRRHRRK